LSSGGAPRSRRRRKQPAGARWTTASSRDYLLAMAELTLGEVVQNPGWLVAASGQLNPNLGVALDAVMGVLRARGDQRLSSGTAALVVQAALRAVSLRAGFL